jgi:N-acyl homoserine lactone hydrolase
MRLYPLRVGTIRAIGAPVPCFLIVTGGAVVLVDTGCAPEPPGERLRPLVDVRPDEVVAVQLARLGFAPGDVDHVVCTHLDPDHAGHHDTFPDAEFVIQRAHHDVARGGAVPRLALARAHWDAPGLRYRQVDGDVELIPGVELIESGGHVPGHQSVLVRLPRGGPVLLAADAIPMACCAEPDTRPILAFDLDAAAVRASTRKLVALAAVERARLVFGHDPRQWADLPKAPDYYD